MTRDLEWVCDRDRLEWVTRDRFILVFDLVMGFLAVVFGVGSAWLLQDSDPVFGMKLSMVWIFFWCALSMTLRTTRHLLRSVKTLEQKVAELSGQIGSQQPKAT